MKETRTVITGEDGLYALTPEQTAGFIQLYFSSGTNLRYYLRGISSDSCEICKEQLRSILRGTLHE